ncbi:MAG: LPXTG cell wall anchor domain-containing protein [Clostridia bacterium]|nr:LPXTG cell wall anchor domain-containing protein [Clostridia bacterium]
MFGTLIFSEDGEYDYRLYEVVDLNKKDIIYDTKMYTVHIVAEGGRARSVTYNGTDTTPMFRNQKVDFNSDKLTARKLFVDTDGKAIELVGGEFSFRATGSDGTVYTGTNSADGMVVFRDSNGNEVNLNALTNTTMFTITETDESYVGTVPTGQSLTYDDNTYYATATVATKAVTVEPVAINDNDKDTTYLTVTFVPKDSDGTTYYLKPLHDPAYSELRSDGTVTFTVPVSKNMENIIGDTWRQYTFKYGIGNYYSGGKEVGTVSFEAKGGNWGQDPVSIRNIKVDEQELSASTRSEKTVSLQYADDSYPVFVNTLQKDEPETVGFTFIKVWEDLNSNITDTWREDITVSLYSQKGKVADFELNSEGGSSGVYSWTGTKNGNGTYMFTIANLPAKDGEDILSYYVTEKQLKGYRIPVYGFIDNSGEVRTETTNMAVDGKVIINIPEASYELPSTGGQGTKLIYILGSILFMSAGMMLWRRRRYF